MRSSSLVALGALFACSACGRFAFDPVDAEPEPPPRWEPIGESTTGGGISQLAPNDGILGPRLAVTADGRPVVSWADDSTVANNIEVYLRMWTGTAWEGLGGSALAGGVSQDPSRSLIGGLTLDAMDQPCQAWVLDESNTLRLRCWDGAAWVGRGGSDVAIATAGNPWWPSVETVGGQLMIAWEDYGAGGGSYAKRFDGSTWTAIGPSTSPGIGSGRLVNLRGPTIDDLHLSWTAADDSDVFVARWTGTAWTELGGPGGVSSSSARSTGASLAIGDRPYLAWAEGEANDQALFVRAWDGAAWVALGGSDAPGGLVPHHHPIGGYDLETGPDGLPVVAYEHAGNLHVVHWDGAAWVASEGVHTTGLATLPTLQIGSDGTRYIVWTERLSDAEQVYLLRLSP